MTVTLRFSPIVLAIIFFNCLACSVKPANAATNDTAPPRSAYTGKITVDLINSANAPILLPELFGINSKWLDSGGGILEFGEMIDDRSFRNQSDAAKRKWIETPNKDIGGRIKHIKEGGSARPWGEKAYPGYLSLSQDSQGYTCVSQPIRENLLAGVQYELHVSARGEEGKPALSVFFANESFLPIEKPDNLAWITPNTWSDNKFILQPDKNQTSGYVRVCIVTPGTVNIDEVRLNRLGGASRVSELANTRIHELGVRSMRWPTGSDADYFDWRESVGPIRDRGENPSVFGVFQTPSWGLHEFLNYCETSGIVPLITINMRESPKSAADLVEYILGPNSSPMGALRAKNGRTKPWDVKHFELGNEPVDVYRADFGSSDAAKGYVKLVGSISPAMRAKAKTLGTQIELKGVLETTFAISDWIKLVPMLSKWNAVVLDKNSGMLKHIDQVKGHFYSGFNWRSSDREMLEEVMGGGATLATTVQRLNKEYGPLPPFWLTEYSLLIQKKKFLFGDEILIDQPKKFQAGLATADLLMTAIQHHFGGAYLFNLAEHATWGVLANNVDFRIRPSGLAFSMLSKMAGERLLPVNAEGGRMIKLEKGDGNSPSKMQYPTLSAVASHSNSAVQLIILNRSYDGGEKLWIDLRGLAPKRADIYQLGPEKLDASNDVRADTVKIKHSVSVFGAYQVINVPPMSLMRIVYPK